MRFKSADPAYAARGWVSSESCQQTLPTSRCLLAEHHWVADRRPSDAPTSAVNVPKWLPHHT